MKNEQDLSDFKNGADKLRRLKIVQTILVFLLFVLLFFIFIISGF